MPEPDKLSKELSFGAGGLLKDALEKGQNTGKLKFGLNTSGNAADISIGAGASQANDSMHEKSSEAVLNPFQIKEDPMVSIVPQAAGEHQKESNLQMKVPGILKQQQRGDQDFEPVKQVNFDLNMSPGSMPSVYNSQYDLSTNRLKRSGNMLDSAMTEKSNGM